MTRRPGMSLIEVLAALFIMGIGLISLFTLFPYGALQYAAAFKDDRTAQCANAAEASMRVYWKERILETHPNSLQEAFRFAMDDPNSDPQEATPLPGRVPPADQKPPVGSPVATPQPVPPLQMTQTDPSYPVFVDPLGWVARSGRTDRYWVAEGGPSEGRIPRRNLFEIERWIPRPPQAANPSGVATARLLALRTNSLFDGLTYSPDGKAGDATGLAAEASLATVQRELRYNWLWVLQRPNNSDRTLAKMSVVVFDKRAHLFAPNTAETVFTPAAAAVGSSTVSFTPGGEPTGIKKGSWLMDATFTAESFVIPGMPPQTIWYSKIRNANFYRAVSVTTTSSQVDVELHQPLRPDSKTRVHPGGTNAGQLIPDATPAERRFVLLAGVADVYEKNPLTNAPSKP